LPRHLASLISDFAIALFNVWRERADQGKPGSKKAPNNINAADRTMIVRFERVRIELCLLQQSKFINARAKHMPDVMASRLQVPLSPQSPVCKNGES
jgi:hypothetical protein